jgi:SAM-dependent methyltransferase
MHLKYRASCRVCGSTALSPAIEHGEQYLQGSFVKPGLAEPSMRKIPTALVRCDPTRNEGGCGLLQMACSVPPAILYAKYWYRSGTNHTMRSHLRGIVNDALALVEGRCTRVLDIGCNDGTLLGFYPASCERFGVDPSDAVENVANATVIRSTFPSAELSKCSQDKLFDVITSIAMFYDLEDPVAFCHSIRQHLSPEGIWVFEVSYMPSMLVRNSYDTICHEHLEYYSLAVLERIVAEAGLKIIDVQLNDCNGGSIRCFVTHLQNDSLHTRQEALTALRQTEFDLALDTPAPYEQFQQRITEHRDTLRAMLLDFKKEGKSIHVYGASTKGNTILQWCGITNEIIDCAAERNPDKFGARTLGTNIPIVSEEKSRALKPDYYLVLPWHFRKEFLVRERDLLAAGTGMIFPLPEPEVFRSRQSAKVLAH